MGDGEEGEKGRRKASPGIYLTLIYNGWVGNWAWVGCVNQTSAFLICILST